MFSVVLSQGGDSYAFGEYETRPAALNVARGIARGYAPRILSRQDIEEVRSTSDVADITALRFYEPRVGLVLGGDNSRRLAGEIIIEECS